MLFESSDNGNTLIAVLARGYSTQAEGPFQWRI